MTAASTERAARRPLDRPFWSLERVADALGHAPVPGGAALRDVVTDTRAIAPGDVFVALRGERFDAHDFLADAVAKGAAALVVADASRAESLDVPTFVVDDTLAALGRLGRYRRRSWAGRVVAVAGSNGKTSTKELLRAALGSALRVHATTGNLNNQVGVPLTLLAIPDDAEVAVIEVGTNYPGEIAILRAIVEPDVAVLTSIGEEHLEGLGDLAGVLREESAVFAGVPLAITPAAQPEVASVARAMAARVIDAGLDAGDVRAERWSIDAEGRGTLTFDGVDVRVPLRGAHNLRNAILALVAARECGVSVADAARGIAGMPVPAMRSAWESVGRATLLNDAYNANPASARAALDLLAALGGARQRVVVLGTMRELGAAAPAMHEQVARYALATGADVVAGVGEFAAPLAALGAGDGRVVTAPDVDELWPLLGPRLAADAIVLLKASRGMRLERVVPYLKAWAGATAPAA